MAQPTTSTPAAPRKSRTGLYIVIGLVLIGGLVAVGVVQNRNKQKGTAVTYEKASIRTITQIVSATGKIQPETEVKISPEVAGEIIALPVREGQSVKKGDLLVKIKPDNYQAQVDQQEAGLASARAAAVQNKAQLFRAQEDFKRSEDLYKKQLISDSEFTQARTNVEVAQANYDSSLAQIRRSEGTLKQSRDQLDKTTIYAPMDGTISILNSEVGERVVATGQFSGTEVMRLANLDDMEVRVNVNENDVVNVKLGDKTRIAVDAYPGRKFNGVVMEIASAARTAGLNTQEEVTNFEVRIRVSDKDVRFRPGMSANAEIETRTVQNVVAVPIQSVTVRSREGNQTIEQLAKDREKKARENGASEGAATAINERQRREAEKADRAALQRVVFLRNGDTVKQVVVETGISDTSHMEISSGLKEGDEVVSGPFSAITRTLKDGDTVRLDKPKPAAAK